MMKKRLLNPTATALWVMLVIATIVSFTVGEDMNVARIAASVAIVIGSLKARLIFIYFMEVAWEPRPFRIVYEIWTVLTVIIILGGYWFKAIMIPLH